MQTKPAKSSLRLITVFSIVSILIFFSVLSVLAKSQGTTTVVDHVSDTPTDRLHTPNLISVTLTVNKVGNGTVTPLGTTVHASGTNVNITAASAPGWQFNGWTGTIGTVANPAGSPTTIFMNGNKNITATFLQICFPLTLGHTGVGSQPVASPTQSAGCSAGLYHLNEVINLTATPTSGHEVASWVGTNNDASTLTTNVLTMPASAASVTVNYVQTCYALNLAASPIAGGSVSTSPLPNCVTDTAKFLSGTNVQITAVPATGYEFTNWSGAVTGFTNPETVVMNSDLTVTATFDLACYVLQLTHTGSGDDPIGVPSSSSGCATGQYHFGQNVNLTADPDPGHQVEDWEGTSNDASTSENNNLSMPAVSHVATVNYISRPTLEFSSASYTVNENGVTATITVERTGSTAEAVTVNYATSNSSATAPADYDSTSDTLSFGTGITSRTFDVTINDDALGEGTETLNLTLSNPSTNAQLGDQDTATLDILDDEGAPTVQFDAGDYSVNEIDGSVTISVTLFPISTDTVFVTFDTSDDTATAGSDYTNKSVTLRFDPGETLEQVDIPIINDALDEANETINVDLSNIFNAALGVSTAIVTISDDDEPPAVQFTEVEYFANEGDATAVISVELDAPSGLEVVVDYDANDLIVGLYATGSVTFAPGETSATFSVSTAGKGAGSEIILILSSPQNATLGTHNTAKLFILEENPGDCHDLVLDRIGAGNYPVANPTSSVGCPAGKYFTDEVIGLTATPNSGWVISHWNGTANNVSISETNFLQMPDSDHTVTIFYITSVYLPIVTEVYTNWFDGPDEIEPNNSTAEANGPLISGIDYTGAFLTSSDLDDYYHVYFDSAGSIELSLTNIAPGHNYDLILRDSDGALMGYSGELNNSNETIITTLPSKGVYYVRIFNRGGTGSAQKYKLRVVYN